jgi:hypothetical protein
MRRTRPHVGEERLKAMPPSTAHPHAVLRVVHDAEPRFSVLAIAPRQLRYSRVCRYPTV